MFLMPNRGGGGGATTSARWDDTFFHAGYTTDVTGATVTSSVNSGLLFAVADTKVTGKMYWEFQHVFGNWTSVYPGLVDEAHRANGASVSGSTELWRNGLGWNSAGRFLVNGANNFVISGYDGLAVTALMFAYDGDTNEIWVGQNGTWVTRTPNVNAGWTGYVPLDGGYPAIILPSIGTSAKLNGTAADMLYTIPTGFTALDGST
jgi:hypothetical protein